MKTMTGRITKALFLLALLAWGIQLRANPAGDWVGSIALPNGKELGIEVTLRQVSASDWNGQISIPVQMISDFALSAVSVDGNEVGFKMEGIPGTPTFSGRYDEQAQLIEGAFRQGGQELTFRLSRGGEKTDSTAGVPESGVPGEGILGDWIGVLKSNTLRLRLAVHFREDEAGTLVGELDSLDQGVSGVKMDTVAYDDGRLTFAINHIDSRYEGTLNAEGTAVEGQFTQFGTGLDLVFLRTDAPVSINRPQEPQGPFPYEENEVAFENREAGIQFVGTLLIPEGEPPFPAVVLVSGSGPQDRDESLMGHRPFAVLADALARCGIVSLRYDDRGVGGSQGDYFQSTTFDFAQDAIEAIRFLENDARVDNDWIGIVGHSEGGLVGPIAASQSDVVDFLILLAPPAEPLDALLLRQREDFMRTLGIGESVLQSMRADVKAEAALFMDESLSDEAVKEAILQRWKESRENYDPALLEKMGLNEKSIQASLRSTATKWFRTLLGIDPGPFLRSLRLPVLALFGEKDVQVDAEVNSVLLRDALEKAGNSDHEVVVLPGLNHLFQNADTGSVAEYSHIEETFDPGAMQRVCDWVLKRR